jgi:hypothetical protein
LLPVNAAEVGIMARGNPAPSALEIASMGVSEAWIGRPGA